MRRAVLVIASALTLVEVLEAEPVVSAKAGNIWLSDTGVAEKQLTTSGRDSEPSLSADHRWIVFVRATPGEEVETGLGPEQATELWRMSVEGSEPKLLLRGRNAEKMENVLAAFEQPRFSSDNRRVYFLSQAWATSGALHVVESETGAERFICSANGFEVLWLGKYKDHLLVLQHRYFVGPGSYDWHWLLAPDGEEIGPVGEDPSQFKELYLED